MYAIVDIETTGGNFKNGKITEVAIVLHNGTSVVEEWSTLINPEMKIPPYISQLTGIYDYMVADAPLFYEVAKKIVELTEEAIFVAHNASFDYSFIKSEFASLGYKFERPTLCTVKMSRKLIPGHPSYSLGNIAKDLGIFISNRHRALGDALATTSLFEILLAKNGGLFLHDDPYQLFSFKDLHPHLSVDELRSLPDQTGVYYLHNQNGDVHYVGKSKNIRNRVWTHLTAPNGKKAIEMQQKTAQISFEITGSELIALLKESDEIKALKPLYNRTQRKAGGVTGISSFTDQMGYLRFGIQPVKLSSDCIASFDNVQEAREILRNWVADFELCEVMCGLSDRSVGCFSYMLRRCKGACKGIESPESYNLRAQQCIQLQKTGFHNAVLVDYGRNKQERSFVFIEGGAYKGYGFFSIDEQLEDVSALKSFLQSKVDTRDARMILSRYLKNKKVLKIVSF